MEFKSLYKLNLYTTNFSKDSIYFIIDNSHALTLKKNLYKSFLKIFCKFNLQKFFEKTFTIERHIIDSLEMLLKDIDKELPQNIYLILKPGYRGKRGAFIVEVDNKKYLIIKFDNFHELNSESLEIEFNKINNLIETDKIKIPKPKFYKNINDVYFAGYEFFKNLKYSNHNKDFFIHFKKFSQLNQVSHYELAPWNVFFKEDTYYILDWSNSDEYVEGYDELYYFLILSYFKRRYFFKTLNHDKNNYYLFINKYSEFIENRHSIDNSQLIKILSYVKKLSRLTEQSSN